MNKTFGQKSKKQMRHSKFKRKQRPGKKERIGQKKSTIPARPESGLITGELRIARDGYGFVITAKAGEEDIFIPARYIGDALHTDVVEVQVVLDRRGRREGRITKVVKHNVTHLMGRLEKTASTYQVVADDKRVRHRIFIPSEKLGVAKAGENVIVRILRYPSGDQPMAGEVIDVLGIRGEESTEKKAVITRHQLERDFSTAVNKEADSAHTLITDDAKSQRTDLKNISFVTIDGETAKDFDDAVAVQRLPAGLIRLWVSIADVSFFVRPGTALDLAAYDRGTSVYFPNDCVPMLPFQLSNDLCSLKPREDRFTLTAEMDIDKNGEVVQKKFYRSVIRSKERMTYTAVKQILVERDPKICEKYKELIPSFDLMKECHLRIRGNRQKRGSIDFDLPEPEIVIDMQGEVSDIVRSERHVGHMMIEDFMIAANESVAGFLTEENLGCIYRVHEPPPPEKLHEFSVLLNNLGYKFYLGAKATPKVLAKIPQMVHGKPEERLVNHTLLRSMSQAVYSAENKGHYGLASNCYCHFTSPIRRYPDLVVHRLMTHAFARAEKTGQMQKPRGLQEIAEHCSKRERVAVEAEREVAKLYAAMFMQAHVGDKFEGIISHITKFGFFVELIDFFVEGLVHIDSMEDDKYFFEEGGMVIRGRKKKRAFKIGDKLCIEVFEVNIPDREISFIVI